MWEGYKGITGTVITRLIYLFCSFIYYMKLHIVQIQNTKEAFVAVMLGFCMIYGYPVKLGHVTLRVPHHGSVVMHTRLSGCLSREGP